jgi:putative copper resistance protein D
MSVGNLPNPFVCVRAVHLAATIFVSGAAFFTVVIAEPAFGVAKPGASMVAAFRRRLAFIVWPCLVLVLLSGAAWLALTSESMSGESLADALSQGVLWIVLLQTDFGNDWLARFVMACALAGVFVPLLSSRGMNSVWLKAAAVILAAALIGSLAWAGHAIGGQGVEGVLHPATDVLHLIAAAAWVGAVVPLALLLAMMGEDATTLSAARAATLRFSALGVAAVATLLVTGIVNTWYLVGSVQALIGTEYGRLLLFKMTLFVGMIGIAAYNWSQLTPALAQSASITAAKRARRQLCRNAAVEALGGALIIGIVALLGTMPPASHVNHHAASGTIPADATFQHIHSEQGMADVTIEPGRVGTADVTIHLLNEDLASLAASELTLTLTAPTPGSKPTTRAASQDADGVWHVDRIELSEPGNWTVAVDAVLTSGGRLQLAAPIVVYAK